MKFIVFSNEIFKEGTFDSLLVEYLHRVEAQSCLKIEHFSSTFQSCIDGHDVSFFLFGIIVMDNVWM